ncbi:beta-lactamase regulating signal transducer with metallopeptidase domain [Actinokineospora baliensis]|uniref:hypothetical protein n=1 Tax=Actinokineospora baliensis TaxID=547056 RepID=UPI00195D9067|nr:hypothetical protein [Actinokineospora baliensis]MBM7771293.1 beta-lactamase regulating signal transducer with metallopeptidase domain [Actinokineospora baliensis]
MATALWIVAAVVAVAVIVWRLRRANTTLETILREERERTEPVEPADDEGPEAQAVEPEDRPHSVGRQHWRH